MAIDPPAPWLLSASPTLEKVIDLPDNIPPSSSNWDCDKITVRYAGATGAHDDCVVQTPNGLASGNGIIFNGSTEQMPVIPPDGYFGLQPIPGQGFYYTFSSAPVIGLYMHFFTSIWDKVDPLPRIVDGRWQYKMVKGPDFSLKDSSGKPLALNVSSIAFSPNGSWMIADVRYWGFIRVNMATFEITPFAPSMNQGSDYASYNAFLTISNDGRYVALKPGNEAAFRVYDMTGCKNIAWPVLQGCTNRDYWPYLNSQLPGFRALYLPRFSSENQLSLSAVYNFTPTQYKVAQYMLTAPGINPKGIEYLGMGDSYASGQGAYNYIEGTDTVNNTCHLSSRSYPFLLSSNLFSSGRSIACSGAKVRDIIDGSQDYEGQVKDGLKRSKRDNINEIIGNYSPGYIVQKDFVEKYNPQAITLSIGGNDIGFADTVKRCVMPALKNTTCYATYEDQQELVKRIEGIENKLKSAYKAVAAPGRRVYIIGYPQLVVSGGDCANNVHLDDKEIQLFIDLTDTLNQVIKRAAISLGAQYVDVSNAFEGHRMCENNSLEVAVNGFTIGNDAGFGKFKFIGSESYHPNALGHDLLRRAILDQTNNLKKPMVSAAPSTAATSALPYAGAPKTGRPVYLSVSDTSMLPDIISPLTTTALKIPSTTAILKPSSSFSIKLDTDTAAVGSATTNTIGEFTGNITIPPETPCGLHTVHVFGQNAANQPVDIAKEVYITSETSDCNGNGFPDSADPCGLASPSGVDIDKDGVDDACDGNVGKPPTYSAYLTGNSIHAVKGPAGAEPIATMISPSSPGVGVLDEASIMPDAALASRQARKSLAELGVMVGVILGVIMYLRRFRYG